MTLWVLNGLIWNEAAGSVESKHVRIEGNTIAEIVDGAVTPDTTGAEVVDAAGKLISAGFIDMHVHLRDPGFEYKEDIATGTRSAAAGGFTTIACMPNTRPVTDTAETVKYILDKAAKEGVVRVLPYAAITKNELGRELTDFASLKEAGAIGFTDDGVGVQNAQMMKNAMTLAKSLDMPVIAHCEDDSLVEGAWASEGSFAKKHGLKGIPNESEAIHVGRDALLSEATGVHYHVCHVSTEQSVRLIRLAKSIGVKITAEVCPHHLVLSDEDIPGVDDANWKMNPPLRTPRDVQAVIEGLEDGTIDIIVTDHAPHSAEEKARGPQLAPFGIVGFETAFPLLYAKFGRTGKCTLGFLLQRMTSDPARVFRLPTGRLEAGAPADLTIVDLENEREVRPETFSSKSNNTPFGGWKLYGWPTTTIYNGQVVYNKA